MSIYMVGYMYMQWVHIHGFMHIHGGEGMACVGAFEGMEAVGRVCICTCVYTWACVACACCVQGCVARVWVCIICAPLSTKCSPSLLEVGGPVLGASPQALSGQSQLGAVPPPPEEAAWLSPTNGEARGQGTRPPSSSEAPPCPTHPAPPLSESSLERGPHMPWPSMGCPRSTAGNHHLSEAHLAARMRAAPGFRGGVSRGCCPLGPGYRSGASSWCPQTSGAA